MKKVLISAAALLAVFGASAQDILLNNPSNHSYFGVRASYDLSCPGKISAGDAKTKVFGLGSGVGLGLIYNQPIVANLYVEPGLTFYYKTESIDPEALSGKLADVFEHRSMRKFGMQVPVQFGYHFDFTSDVNVAIMTGPVLNVGFSDDYYVTTKSVGGHDLHASGTVYGEDGLMNRVDCAWRFGVAVNFAKNYYVGVSGEVGMCNMLKDTDGKVTFHQNAVDFTLGYNF